MKRIDLTGQKFGKWLVLRLDKNKTTKHASYWLCQCECGNISSVFSGNLTRGHSKSCGCQRSEISAQQAQTHGESKTRLYTIWNDMKARCSRPGNRIYHDRGITVCEEWYKSYEAFRDWAVSNGYDDELQIDRVDNNKGYFPDNCRWVTVMQNQNNRRDNVRIKYHGEIKTLKEWSRTKKHSL